MIYAIRHGQDDERFIGGWSKAKLTLEGTYEIKRASIWIKDNLNITNIVSSDIYRAKQTACIINDILKVPIKYNENLREQNKGILNGVPVVIAKQIYKKYLNINDVDFIYPNGESLRNLYNRILNYLIELESLEDNTLLVTHRGVINMIYYIFNMQELDMNKNEFMVTPGSIHEIDFKNKLIRKVR